jgi:hypothetical protein
MYEFKSINLISNYVCQCADCENYRSYVENSPCLLRSGLPSVECSQDSFHQTLVLHGRQPDHSQSSLLPSTWPPSLPDSLVTRNDLHREQQKYRLKRSHLSASTGRIIETRDEHTNDRSRSCPALVPHCKNQLLYINIYIFIVKGFSS